MTARSHAILSRAAAIRAAVTQIRFPVTENRGDHRAENAGACVGHSGIGTHTAVGRWQSSRAAVVFPRNSIALFRRPSVDSTTLLTGDPIVRPTRPCRKLRCEWILIMNLKLTRPFRGHSFLMICWALCSLFAVGIVMIGCHSVPISERRQLLLITEDEEQKMGLTAYSEVLSKEPVTSNETAAELVRRVGNRIAAVANRPDFDWEFNVIEAETQNAFCLPGGKVAVYTGILPVCETEAGLAVVMSHEIAHALARHGGERMSHQMVQNKAKDTLGYLMRDSKDTTQKIVMTAYGAGAQYGVIMPYSRKHELEADKIGILLMAGAGYDPVEAPRFWERFAGLKDSKGPLELLSTHPSDARRSEALRGMLPEALELYRAAPEKIGNGSQLADVLHPGSPSHAASDQNAL